MGKEQKGLFSWANILEKVGQHFSLTKNRMGIDPDFVFMPNYRTQSWLDVVVGFAPEYRKIIKDVSLEALNRTVEERDDYISGLSEERIELIIGPNAKKKSVQLGSIRQFIININSMSEENLTSLSQALEQLEVEG